MSTKKKKMNSADRRRSIINAARPLFAQYGYQGASVRKIAKAAGVSEALLYQHFPSKEELYQEILRYGVDVSSILFNDRMKNLNPGAESLAAYIYVAFKLILTEVPQYEEAQHWHERLLFQSLIGDRAYAVAHFKHLSEILKDPVARHMEASQKAGDLVAPIQSPANRFWFIHHLAMALNLCHLSGEPACQYEGSREDLLREAVLFSLRGLGLTDKALKRCFKPDKLEAFYHQMIDQSG
jgi:AcrR family transcriptional regulator